MNTCKELSIHLSHELIHWVKQPITHVAVPALLFIVHLLSYALWETAINVPVTSWTVVLFGLVFWFSGGLVHYLDTHHYFEEGAIADFFGFTDLD